MKTSSLNILFFFLLALTIVSVNCQDEDTEDEYEEESETERATTEAVVEEAAAAINQTAISELIQAAFDTQAKKATITTTTLPPLRTRTTTTVAPKGNETETDSVFLSALVQAALRNANIEADEAPTLKTKKNITKQSQLVDSDQLDITMSQTNKILEGITRGNVSSVVENSLKIRAPESVQGIIINMVSLVSGWNGGLTARGTTEQCNCSENDPLYRTIKNEMEKYRKPRSEPEPESLEYIMGQVSKVMEGVMSGNISNIVENSLRIRAPPNVQKTITHMVTFLRNRVPGAGIRPVSDQLCRCEDKSETSKPVDPVASENEIFRGNESTFQKPNQYYINPYKTVFVIKKQ